MLLWCLECIVNQEYIKPDIFVLENGSNDSMAEVYCSRFPAVQFYKSENNIGFAAGNNLLFQKAKGYEWIALVNPDAFLEPDWLTKMLSAAKAHPEYSFLPLVLSCLRIMTFLTEMATLCIYPDWRGGKVIVSRFLMTRLNGMKCFPRVRRRRFIGAMSLKQWVDLMRIIFAILRM